MSTPNFTPTGFFFPASRQLSFKPTAFFLAHATHSQLGLSAGTPLCARGKAQAVNVCNFDWYGSLTRSYSHTALRAGLDIGGKAA